MENNIERLFENKISQLQQNNKKIYFIDMYDSLKNNSKKLYYRNFDSKFWKDYEQIIEREDSVKNINWKYIKKKEKLCTISVAFYKKESYPGGLLTFKKYEYGLISFFISLIFLNLKNNFSYNIRFYINPKAREILCFIIETIITYIEYYIKNKEIPPFPISNDEQWGIQLSLHTLFNYYFKINKRSIDYYSYTINRIFENIEIFEYSFNESNKLYEDNRSIGMFMRLLPLFYDINLNSNKLSHYCNKVLVSDIDTHFRRRRQNYLKLLIDEEFNFGYTSRVGYEFSLHNKCDKDRYPFMYPVINLFIYQYNTLRKLPYQIFKDFYIHNLNLLETENQMEINYLKKCGVQKIFGYGHDEIFTNKYILQKYIKDPQISIKSYLRNGYYSLYLELLDEVIKNLKSRNNGNKVQVNDSGNLFESISTEMKEEVTLLLKSFFNLEVILNNKKNTNFQNNMTNKEENSNSNNNTNVKKWKFFNYNSVSFNSELSKLNSVSLQKMYNNLKKLSPNSTFAKELSKIFILNAWKPNINKEYITLNKFKNNTKELLFYPHSYINKKFESVIDELEKKYNIIVSNELKRAVEINRLISEKFKYNHSSNTTNKKFYNYYIDHWDGAPDYYHYYLVMPKYRNREIILTRYITDKKGEIIKDPIALDYRIDFNDGIIEEI
jgi:hypothetical protein